jgi:hypothetical protein
LTAEIFVSANDQGVRHPKTSGVPIVRLSVESRAGGVRGASEELQSSARLRQELVVKPKKSASMVK